MFKQIQINTDSSHFRQNGCRQDDKLTCLFVDDVSVDKMSVGKSAWYRPNQAAAKKLKSQLLAVFK
jgi:hypothetical protein